MSTDDTPARFLRDNIRTLAPYTPGEQPQTTDWIKLNTNENSNPPSPLVLRALAESVDERLRLYPDPLSMTMRRRLQDVYGVPPEQSIVGNGSDELIAVVFRACLGPKDLVAFNYPSYGLYRVLANTYGIPWVEVPLRADYRLEVAQLAATSARVVFIANPNSPSGVYCEPEVIHELCLACGGLVVVDEAYIDFGGESALPLVETHDNLLILRTMSKSFSLAGMRIGYGFGRPELISGLHNVRDSYNMNRLNLVAGTAALDEYAAAMENARAIAERRNRFAETMVTHFAFAVLPSRSNFVLVDARPYSAELIYEQLKLRRILVRYFAQPRLASCLRITIGTEEEMRVLVETVGEIIGRIQGQQA